MRKGERAEWMALLAAERHARRQDQIEWMATIKSLADRIQHPSVREVTTPDDYEPPEIPAAFAEMAQVGNPIFDLGSAEEQKEIEKIGNVYEQ